MSAAEADLLHDAGTSWPPPETYAEHESPACNDSAGALLGELLGCVCDCCFPNDSAVLDDDNATQPFATERPRATHFALTKSPLERAIAASFMIGTALFACAGNMLVIVAVCTTKRLKTVTNLYVVSLAISDILVGSVILPFAISIEVAGGWIFSNLVCKLWVAFDVLLCTASILNLCCIALDRYFAITQPLKYITRRSRRAARTTIASAWLLSAIISLPPFLGWIEDPNEIDAAQCYLIRDPGYVVFSAIGSFYAPVVLLLVLYIRIFRIAQRRRRLSIFKEAAAASVVAIRRCARGMVIQKNSDEPGTEGVGCDSVQPTSTARGSPKAESASNSLNGSRHGPAAPSETSTCITDVAPLNSLAESTASSLRKPKGTSLKRKLSCAISGHRQRLTANQEGDRRSFRARKPREEENEQAVRSAVQIMVEDGRYVASLPGLDVDITDEYDRIMREQAQPRKMTELSNMLSHMPTNFLLVMSARTAGLNADTRRRSTVTQSAQRLKQTQPTPPTEEATITAHIRQKRKEKVIFHYENKAAQTLAIVMGVFIFCWTGFFVTYVVEGFCPSCKIPNALQLIVSWLGYGNSAMNFMIYALYNKDFRRAFLVILSKVFWCLRAAVRASDDKRQREIEERNIRVQLLEKAHADRKKRMSIAGKDDQPTLIVIERDEQMPEPEPDTDL